MARAKSARRRHASPPPRQPDFTAANTPSSLADTATPTPHCTRHSLLLHAITPHFRRHVSLPPAFSHITPSLP